MPSYANFVSALRDRVRHNAVNPITAAWLLLREDKKEQQCKSRWSKRARDQFVHRANAVNRLIAVE